MFILALMFLSAIVAVLINKPKYNAIKKEYAETIKKLADKEIAVKNSKKSAQEKAAEISLIRDDVRAAESKKKSAEKAIDNKIAVILAALFMLGIFIILFSSKK